MEQNGSIILIVDTAGYNGPKWKIMDPSVGEITQQLASLRGGNAAAKDALAELVYPAMHARAVQYMRGERSDHTLQPTALVSEVFLELFKGQTDVEWQDRAHFLAVASSNMRRILVDHARRRKADLRGGGLAKVDLDVAHVHVDPARSEEILDLDAALKELAEMDPRQARLVELMHFGGLTEEEAAEVEGIHARTVRRDWASARAWLQTRLRKPPA